MTSSLSLRDLLYARVTRLAENMADMARKGRAPGVSMPGEANPFARLTDADVRAMRAEYARGGVTYRSIARRLGVSRHTVGLAVRNKTWRHV